MSQSLTTIAAIATPIGRGGIGVIRISGSNAFHLLEQLTQRQMPPTRQAGVRSFWSEDGEVIDEGLVLCFAAPHSFTGEHVVEIQGHGGVVVQNMLLSRLFVLGAVPAQPGEFSMRAFENGKLDLLQAEAIADLIDATSQAAARSAVRSLQGEFSTRITDVLQHLIEVRLHVEAAIDFPEEEIDFLADGRILGLIDAVSSAIIHVQQAAKQGQLLREGIQVVIAGRPNAGKSSLLNALAGHDRAIVTDIAGTTRDVLHEKIQLGQLTLTLTDTAGLRESDDVVEQEGIRRAHQAIEQADLLLLVYDATQEQTPLALAEQFFSQAIDPQHLILIANKCDLLQIDPMLTNHQGFHQVFLSAKHVQGIDDLVTAIEQCVGFMPSEDQHRVN